MVYRHDSEQTKQLCSAREHPTRNDTAKLAAPLNDVNFKLANSSPRQTFNISASLTANSYLSADVK
jgi:hypothetical protein